MFLQIVFSFLIFSPLLINAQQRLAAFDGNLTQQETMLVSWTMKAGVTCIDLSLEHADQSMIFRQIHFIPGICGDDLSETSYTFEQTAGIDVKNYYRVKFGLDGYSDTLVVEVPLLGSNGMILGPQPASSFINVKFNNPLSTSFSLILTNLSGQVVLSNEGITSNEIELNTSSLKSGLYILRLNSSYNSWTQRVIISH